MTHEAGFELVMRRTYLWKHKSFLKNLQLQKEKNIIYSNLAYIKCMYVCVYVGLCNLSLCIIYPRIFYFISLFLKYIIFIIYYYIVYYFQI